MTLALTLCFHIALHALLDGMSFQLMLDPELDADEVRTKVLRLADRMLKS